MDWPQRLENYTKETGFPLIYAIGPDGKVYLWWTMGNDYRVASGYYGGYPATYLKRVKALFPDKRRVLHLFSGKVDTVAFPGATVDINPDRGADFVDDAQRLENVPVSWKTYQAKTVKGVSILSTTFFAGWGAWNLYYPSLDQMWSFAGGTVIMAANVLWISMMIYYTRQERRRNRYLTGLQPKTRFKIETEFGEQPQKFTVWKGRAVGPSCSLHLLKPQNGVK